MNLLYRRIINHLEREWQVIRHAPLTLGLIAGIAVGGVWFVLSLAHELQISALQAIIRSREELIDALREALQSSSTDMCDTHQTIIGSTNQKGSHFNVILDRLLFVGVEHSIPLPPSVTERHLLVVIASVRNVGAHSVAGGWKLTLQIGERAYVGERITPPDTFVVRRTYPRPACVRFYGKDSLIEKTRIPIPSGDLRQGVLLYTFPEAAAAELVRAHAVVKLECTDVQGEIYEGSWRISAADLSGAEIPTGLTTDILSVSECN